MYDPLELVERSSDAAFAIDGALRVLAWNARAEALLDISHQEAVKQTCHGLLAGRSEQGEAICGPGCAAVTCFARDIPFSHPEMMVKGAGGKDRRVHVGSIVLPEPVQEGMPKAIIFLRPVDAEEVRDFLTGAPTLRVYTLGRFRLEAEGKELDWRAWPRRQAVTLLKILVSHRGRPVHRDVLIEALWPDLDPKEGLKRLKVVVHGMRRGLEPLRGKGNGPSGVTTEGEGYCLPVGEGLWVDADRFQALAQQTAAAAARGRWQEAIAAFEAAAALYGGDYLEDDRYSDWVALERERLQEVYLTLLLKGASLYAESGLLEGAVQTCQKAVAIDPCRESAQRLLMACLWKSDRRAEALRQFGLCRQALRQELNVDPMPETVELYQRIHRTTTPSLVAAAW
jgi:DNA-binding SARP family transcriptional activator